MNSPSTPTRTLKATAGNTLVEYGLVAGLVLLVTMPELYLISNQVRQWTNGMKTGMTSHHDIATHQHTQDQTVDRPSQNQTGDTSSPLSVNIPALHQGQTTNLRFSDGSIVHIIYDRNTITVAGANGERSVIPFPRNISNPTLVFANNQFLIQAGQDTPATQSEPSAPGPTSYDSNSTTNHMCRSVKCYTPGFHPGSG